jgi:two-component system NarL family sensor kinase
MLLLACGIIFFVILYQRKVIRHQMELKKIEEEKQQELIKASFESEERERNRIAAELHDDVGTTLSSARLYLYKTKTTPENMEAIQQSKKLLDEGIQKVRDISHKLQPSALDTFNLHHALTTLSQIIDRSEVVHMDYNAAPYLAALDRTVALSVYRVAQELTNNIIKHGHPKNITLSFQKHHAELQMIIRHDGEGITNEQFLLYMNSIGSSGLKNIVNRLNSVQGKILFHKTEEGSFQILITLPL